MDKKRETNFEVLRIISIVMIIFHHLAVHSGFDFESTSISLNQLWIQFIQIGGKIGVNIFVLISGYFLINSDKIKISKILKLWGQIFFTSIAIYIIFIVSGLEQFEIKEMLKALFPISLNEWWFASTYFFLYIISPFLNIILRKINRKTYKYMLICCYIIFVFIDKNFQWNPIMWFVILYSLAGYIKLYGDNWKINNKKCLIIAVTLIILTYFTVIFLDLMNFRVSTIDTNITYFYRMQRLPIVLISLFLFLGFKNSNIKYSEAINKVAVTTFGIYLLHDNSYMRSFLWEDLFKVKIFEKSNILIPYSILVCLIVFFSCILIDFIRIYVIEKYYMKIVYKIEHKINNTIDKIVNLKPLKYLKKS